jgi:hypothetical protein
LTYNVTLVEGGAKFDLAVVGVLSWQNVLLRDT